MQIKRMAVKANIPAVPFEMARRHSAGCVGACDCWNGTEWGMINLQSHLWKCLHELLMDERHLCLLQSERVPYLYLPKTTVAGV